jgi:hypothetical protein
MFEVLGVEYKILVTSTGSVDGLNSENRVRRIECKRI